MNTKALAKHYETLTPWERVPLIAAANSRGDETEANRLARSAPTNSFKVPEYFGLSEGLVQLAALHVMTQLDRAVIYWRVESALDYLASRSAKYKGGQREDGLWTVMQMLCFRVQLDADAWKLLCAELKIDPEPLLRGLPGYESVKQMEECARLVAFTAEEATVFLRQSFEQEEVAAGKAPPANRVYRMCTAADVARDMREYLESHLASWR